MVQACPSGRAAPPPPRDAGVKRVNGTTQARLVGNLVNYVVALEYARAQLPAVIAAFASFGRPRSGDARPRRGRDRQAGPVLSAFGAALDVAVTLMQGAQVPLSRVPGTRARRLDLWPNALCRSNPSVTPYNYACGLGRAAHYGDGAAFVRRGELDSRVIVMAGAPPSAGPGAIAAPSMTATDDAQADAVNDEAIEYYREQGERVAALNGSVLLCCIGHAQIGTRVLARLVEPCGGQILSYPEPGEQLASDLLWGLFAGASREQSRPRDKYASVC